MTAVYTCSLCCLDYDDDDIVGCCENWRSCGAEFVCGGCCSWVEDDLLCNDCETKHEAKQEAKETSNPICNGCNSSVPDDDNGGNGTLVDGKTLCNWCLKDAPK